MVAHLLDISGIGSDRLQLSWVSAAEGQLFARYVTEFSEKIRELGPFNREENGFRLDAVVRTLDSPRIRWLMGMTRVLTERENVYHEKLKEEDYNKLVSEATRSEYHKALLIESLGKGPRTVREMAEDTGLPVYTVSQRLNELERSGQAELKEYNGTTPLFVSTAA